MCVSNEYGTRASRARLVLQDDATVVLAGKTESAGHLRENAMIREMMIGAAAGAAGTAALNATTYADIALRGRPPSQLPVQTVDKLSEKAGIALDDRAIEGSEKEKLKNRKSGIGALLGYGAGLSVGMLYGLLRTGVNPPLPLAAAGLTVAVMAAGDGPPAVLGATNPRQWGLTDWLSDIVPHFAYGLVAAAAYNAFASRQPAHAR
jgi:hypothetical protein